MSTAGHIPCVHRMIVEEVRGGSKVRPLALHEKRRRGATTGASTSYTQHHCSRADILPRIKNKVVLAGPSYITNTAGIIVKHGWYLELPVVLLHAVVVFERYSGLDTV